MASQHGALPLTQQPQSDPRDPLLGLGSRSGVETCDTLSKPLPPPPPPAEASVGGGL